ncbi:MAG: YIP1 family protein [Burkholderiales bacterium]|nr:YIP1 family protein [Burkholderiales bacterium]
MPSYQRLRAILLEPRNAWARIAAEPATVQSLALGWILGLAAIGPLAMLVGYADLGLARSLRLAVGAWLTTLVVTFLLALIVDTLAPSFGGRRDYVASLKLVAYAFTAIYLAGIGHVMGQIGGAIVLAAAVVSWISFGIGAPMLRRCTPDRSVAFTLVVLVAWLALAAIAGYATSGGGIRPASVPRRLL